MDIHIHGKPESHTPFSRKFLMGFRSHVKMYRPNFKSVNLPVPEIIASGVLGALQSRERGIGGREW